MASERELTIRELVERGWQRADATAFVRCWRGHCFSGTEVSRPPAIAEAIDYMLRNAGFQPAPRHARRASLRQRESDTKGGRA